jgi:hypothetical protein
MKVGRSLLAAGLCVLTASCAKKAPPSGGPPDIQPPTLVASHPDSGAASVPRNVALSMTFSEGMEPRSTADAIALSPPVEIRQFRWSGRTVTAVLRDTLRSHQTYTLFVGYGARDRHGNTIERGRALVFTTGTRSPREPSGGTSRRKASRPATPTCGATKRGVSPTAPRATSTPSGWWIPTECSGCRDFRSRRVTRCGRSRI